MRTTSREAWNSLEALVTESANSLAAEHGAVVEVEYRRGMPPIENDAALTALLEHAARRHLGAGAAVPTEQSMGGDDFGWYGTLVPVTFARLGVDGRPGAPGLHQGGFDVDEAAIRCGVLLLAGLVLAGRVAPAGIPGQRSS